MLHPVNIHEPSDGAWRELPLRVLLVEDDPAFALLMRESLSEPGGGARVECAASLADALTWLGFDCPDAILLDLSLPDSSGIETLGAIRRVVPTVPIVVFTGADSEAQRLEAFRAGADDYLVKGRADAEIVLRTLRYAIERGQNARALRRSEERLASAMRGANDGWWEWDFATDEVYYSPRWKEMLGHSEDEIGRRASEWLERVHADDIERVTAELAAHREGVLPRFQNEHRVRHKDGSYRWMLVRGLVQRDEHGTPLCIAGTFADITPLKVMEARLLQANAEAQAIVRALPDAYLRLGADGTVRDAHTGPHWDAGLLANVAVGRKLQHTLPPVAAQKVQRAMQTVAQSRAPFTVEISMTQGGRERFYEGRFVPLLATQFVAIFRDISERKLAEQEVRKLNASLQSELERRAAELQSAQARLVRSMQVEALGKVAAGIAAGLNEPTAEVLAHIGEARQLLAPESAAAAHLDAALAKAQRWAHLIEDLSTYARAQLEAAAAQAPGDVNTAVQAAVDRARERLCAERIQVAVQLAGGLPAVALSDPSLQQIATQLLANACDAMAGAARRIVMVETRRDRKGVCLIVRDSGSGMDESVQGRAFDLFYSSKPGRTGLGLSLCKELVENSGGQIHIESKPAGGTVVRVVLPVVEDAVAAQSGRDGKTRLLIMDADPAVAREFGETLGTARYEIFHVSTGAEALEQVRPGAFDLVCLGVSGRNVREVLEALRGIRAADTRVRISIFTPFQNDLMRPLWAAASEGLDFELVGKPVDKNRIRRVVQLTQEALGTQGQWAKSEAS